MDGVDIHKMTVRDLRDLIFERGLVPKKWMINYIKKSEAISMLEMYSSLEEVPSAYIQVLTKRQNMHQAKSRAAKANRSKLFALDTLTRDEILKHIFITYPDLRFTSKGIIEEGFISATGAHSATNYYEFSSKKKKFMFTKAEVEYLISLGLDVPKSIFYMPKKQKSKVQTKSLRSLF